MSQPPRRPDNKSSNKSSRPQNRQHPTNSGPNKTGTRNNGPRNNGARHTGSRSSGPKLPIERRHGNARVFVAIDTADFGKAKTLVDQLRDSGAGFKLGLEFFMAHGVPGIARLLGSLPLFLDLKFHDIPNTVAGGLRSIAPLRPTIVNVHATGGVEMMKAAKKALVDADATDSKLIAVTVLTSLDGSDLKAQGLDSEPEAQSLRLAKQVAEAGLDGVVCSAKAATAIRDALGDDFLRVTPGMRVALGARHDQKQTMAPGDAMQSGASHLVVGRLVTGAPDPKSALRSILNGLG